MRTDFSSTRAKWRFSKSGCRTTPLTTPTLSERRYYATYIKTPRTDGCPCRALCSRPSTATASV